MSDSYTARKLWCLDQVLRDKRATHFDFRFAYYVGSVTDRATGEARFKQSTAATALGVTSRGIQLAADRLKTLGHIDISFSPGRGRINGYRLCRECTNANSPFDRESTNELAPIIKESTNGHSYKTAQKDERPAHKGRTTRRESTNGHSHSLPCLIPCLIPTRGRERAFADALGSLGASLEQRLGADVARSWFGKASITDLVGDTLTIQLPNQFIVERVRSNYEPVLRACCSALVPGIKAVRMVAA
jgi:hypothetical protein